MEDTKYQKSTAWCLVPPSFDRSLIFQQKSRVYLSSLLPISFPPLRCGYLSSPLTSMEFIFSYLSFWFGVFHRSLLLIFPFLPFSLIPWLLHLFQGLAGTSSPSVEVCGVGPCPTPFGPRASRTFSPGCWNPCSLHPDLQKAQFSIGN